MNITVYLASSTGNDPKFEAAVKELGDAFIAFPGGVGTLEEVSEIMSKISLGHLQVPCIYYNLDGYYDDIKHFLQQMIAKGFSSEEKQQGVYFAESLEEIKKLLK